MQAEVNETEVVKDTQARSNICWGCGEIGHFYKGCRNPNKRQYWDQMKQKKSLKFKWQMEGEKDFDEEAVEALVSRFIKRGDTYKGKFKKLENAVATGKTIATTTGTKLVMIPKTSANRIEYPSYQSNKSWTNCHTQNITINFSHEGNNWEKSEQRRPTQKA